MGMNLSLKVRHPKCVNNYVYYTSPCGKALQRYRKICYPANLFCKKSLLPRNLILIKKERVSEFWHTLGYDDLIGAIISYLVVTRTITSYLSFRIERLFLISHYCSNDYFSQPSNTSGPYTLSSFSSWSGAHNWAKNGFFLATLSHCHGRAFGWSLYG